MIKRFRAKQLIWAGFILLLLLCVLGETLTAASNQQSAVLYDSTEKVILDPYIDILEDKSRTLTIDDVSSELYSERFEKYVGNGRPNLGYSLSYYWVRIKIKNESIHQNWLLELDSPKINQLELFQFDEQYGEWQARATGNTLPFKNRDINHRNFVYEVSLQSDGVQTLYLRVFSGSSVQIPLTLWQPLSHSSKSQIEYALFGVVFGISIVMALYNLFLYFSVGGRSYLYYVVFVFLNTCLFISDTGLAFQFFGRNSPYGLDVR